MADNEVLIPPILLDLGQRVRTERASMSATEVMAIKQRLSVVRDYCVKLLSLLEPKKSNKR
jgi:hypothetical protein